MKTEWDFSSLEKEGSFEEKRNEIKENVNKFVEKWKRNKIYLEDSKKLKEALDEYENLVANHLGGGDEHYYFWLKTQLDQNNSGLRAKFNKIDAFQNNIQSELNFFEISLSKINKEKKESFLKDNLLKEYRHFLESLFIKEKHLLGEKEEKIMVLKSAPSYSFWIDMVSSFLSREEIIWDEKTGEKKTYSEIRSLMDNQNEEIRKKSARAFNKIIKKYEDVAEKELNAVLEDKRVNDEIRKFNRPDKSRHLKDDIDTEIVDSLINSVSENYNISKRFYILKAKLMKIEKFSYSERSIDYGCISKRLDYKNSIELIKKVFEDLNPKFKEVLENFLNQGKIDVFPKKGKRDGAFCVDSLKRQPVFVMLNYTERLTDVLTFAHEMGHAIHKEFMKEKNNALNIGTPKSTAEVAGTFMEDFVLEYLLEKSDEEEKFVLIIQKLQEDIQTIFRQVACYKFEQNLHKTFREKGYLSKEDIGKLFSEEMKKYLGEIFKEGDDLKNGWVYWPHIRNYFYNYSYASGQLISKFLQSLVRKDKKNIEKVEKIFYTGTSDSPKNIFKKIGAEISKKEFWDKGLKEIEILLDYAEELAKKLGKI